MPQDEPRPETPHPAVVSQVTGHFREMPGYATWRPRGTPDYLLMLTRDGAGRVGFPGGEVRARPGDIALLRPGALHDYGTARDADGWELLWTHFLPRPHWLPWLGWPEAAPGLLHLSLPSDTYAAVNEALEEMHRWAASGGLPRRDEFALNALERALLWCDAANPRRDEAKIDARVRRAMAHLLENLSEPVSLADLADVAGLSPSRLSHLFREQTGQTPQQFQEKARLDRARQLLSLTGRTVAAVAEEVGFASPFYFTLRFKKHTGLSPTEWRRNEQGE
jgi:AraC family transcriptional regulator of arabinose operon